MLVTLRESDVTIDLKNGVKISGIIEECDGNMNLTIHQVTQISLKGDVKKMDVAFVNGSSILYIHLPPGNIRRHVHDYVSHFIFLLYLKFHSFWSLQSPNYILFLYLS